MKIYTVDRYGVNPFVEVTYRFLPDGSRHASFTIGESGRGRKLAIIPVVLRPSSRTSWEVEGHVAVENVEVCRNFHGYVYLKELEKPVEDDCYLIVFRGWIGFRGSNSLTDYEGRALSKNVVLAEGRIAQGEAGRMGAGSQWLLMVRVGDLLRYEVDGRLYGEPGSYVLACTSNGPVLYEEEVWYATQGIEA
jgi:hypothetical protein